MALLSKSELRARVLKARRSAPVEVRERADTALCQAISSWVRSEHPTTVAAYVPLPNEPGGTGLLDALSPARVLLPVLREDHDLDWAPYEGTLIPGPRGLSVPPGPRLGPDTIRTATLVIVPAVAVDSQGVRLGRGGGSYDRTLARLDETVLTLAPLYAGELVDEVPALPHDRRVGGVVLPDRGVVYLPLSAGRTGGL